MRLSEKYRPKRLADVVGQFPVRLLRAFVQDPYPCCFLLESPAPGTGKTATAFATAAELGCEDEMSGLHCIIASELSVDRAREMFDCTLRMRPMTGRGWQCLVIEELEFLSPQCQTFLKVALETRLPSRAIVIGTSNGVSKLQKALLQRFTILQYSGGRVFGSACRERLAEIWRAEFGDRPLPAGWQEWGYDGDEFSFRAALDSMQRVALLSEQLKAVG